MNNKRFILFGLAIGTSMGIAISMVIGNIAYMPIGEAIGISCGLICYAIKEK